MLTSSARAFHPRCRRRVDRHVENQENDETVLTSRDRGSRNGLGRQIPARPFAGCVLLVDDIDEDAAVLAVLLEPLEASVVVARSAEEALAILDTQVVDLVITDLNMPAASGLDLARELRRRHDPPAVIFTTGSQCAGDRVAAFELGAVAYLQKPVEVGHLIEFAREILHSRCAARTSAA
jgi:CheY-like chemotaxis protein